jgi:hypothetical protein
MNETYINNIKEALVLMEGCFKHLERVIPSPVFIDDEKGRRFEYGDESLEAAVVQKSARMISGLNASLVLLSKGYFQELGAIFRMVDEFSEDINFLCLPLLGKERTKLHDDYLQCFYQDEFDVPGDPLKSNQKRPMIPRKKVMAAISNLNENPVNSSDSQDIFRTLSQTYSGYVHGASGHIMEMYSYPPGGYHLQGMNSEERLNAFLDNMLDYTYRSLLSIMFVAMAFKQDKMVNDLFAYRAHFEDETDILNRSA